MRLNLSKSGIKTPYEILEVPMDASSEQISSAYRQLAKRYHPDRVADLAPEIRNLAEKRMKLINTAYQMIKEGKTCDPIDLGYERDNNEVYKSPTYSGTQSSEKGPYPPNDLVRRRLPYWKVYLTILFLIVIALISFFVFTSGKLQDIRYKDIFRIITQIDPKSLLSMDWQSDIRLKNIVLEYFTLIENNDIDAVINLYSSERKNDIRKIYFKQNAKQTVKYRIDEVKTHVEGTDATVYVSVWQRKIGIKEERGFLIFSMKMENGEWKIWSTSGEKKR